MRYLHITKTKILRIGMLFLGIILLFFLSIVRIFDSQPLEIQEADADISGLSGGNCACGTSGASGSK